MTQENKSAEEKTTKIYEDLCFYLEVQDLPSSALEIDSLVSEASDKIHLDKLVATLKNSSTKGNSNFVKSSLQKVIAETKTEKNQILYAGIPLTLFASSLYFGGFGYLAYNNQNHSLLSQLGVSLISLPLIELVAALDYGFIDWFQSSKNKLKSLNKISELVQEK